MAGPKLKSAFLDATESAHHKAPAHRAVDGFTDLLHAQRALQRRRGS